MGYKYDCIVITNLRAFEQARRTEETAININLTFTKTPSPLYIYPSTQ